jgi:hypothetical protein
LTCSVTNTEYEGKVKTAYSLTPPKPNVIYTITPLTGEAFKTNFTLEVQK